MLTRETVTFRDGNGWSWEFDLTFMLSNYECIWGRGCPDTRLEHTARGGPVAFPSLLGSSRPLSDHRALPSSSAEVKAAVVPEPGRTYSRTNDIAGQGRDLRDCCLRAAFACAAGCRVDTMV